MIDLIVPSPADQHIHIRCDQSDRVLILSTILWTTVIFAHAEQQTYAPT